MQAQYLLASLSAANHVHKDMLRTGQGMPATFQFDRKRLTSTACWSLQGMNGKTPPGFSEAAVYVAGSSSFEGWDVFEDLTFEDGDGEGTSPQQQPLTPHERYCLESQMAVMSLECIQYSQYGRLSSLTARYPLLKNKERQLFLTCQLLYHLSSFLIYRSCRTVSFQLAQHWNYPECRANRRWVTHSLPAYRKEKRREKHQRLVERSKHPERDALYGYFDDRWEPKRQ